MGLGLLDIHIKEKKKKDSTEASSCNKNLAQIES